MMISASSRAFVLNGENTLAKDKAQESYHRPSAYPILPLTPAWMEYSVTTMLHRLTAQAHLFRVSIEPRLHDFQDSLVLPA